MLVGSPSRPILSKVPHICIQECTSPLFLPLSFELGCGGIRRRRSPQGGATGLRPSKSADRFYFNAFWIRILPIHWTPCYMEGTGIGK